MIIIAKALVRCLFDGAVHPLNLVVCPGMFYLGQAMLDAVCFAGSRKDVAEIVNVAGTIGKLNTIVCQHSVDGIENCFDQIAQELGGRHLTCLPVQFGIVKLGRPVDGDEEVAFAFGGVNFSNINVKIADGIGF